MEEHAPKSENVTDSIIGQESSDFSKFSFFDSLVAFTTAPETDLVTETDFEDPEFLFFYRYFRVDKTFSDYSDPKSKSVNSLLGSITSLPSLFTVKGRSKGDFLNSSKRRNSSCLNQNLNCLFEKTEELKFVRSENDLQNLVHFDDGIKFQTSQGSPGVHPKSRIENCQESMKRPISRKKSKSLNSVLYPVESIKGFLSKRPDRRSLCDTAPTFHQETLSVSQIFLIQSTESLDQHSSLVSLDDGRHPSKNRSYTSLIVPGIKCERPSSLPADDFQQYNVDENLGSSRLSLPRFMTHRKSQTSLGKLSKTSSRSDNVTKKLSVSDIDVSMQKHLTVSKVTSPREYRSFSDIRLRQYFLLPDFGYDKV